MASSFYSNAQHVDFESVLGMDYHEMVSMFEALVASGLRGFLGCPAVVYEDYLVDFFENASVRSGVIISTVGGQLVEISEELFAESFELPVNGLGDLSEMPKDVIFDARSIVSLSEELAKEARSHGLTWTKPCCSKIFEGSPRDRGAVIARANSNTRLLCCIRKMILVDGLWTVELCADKWVKIPRKIISTEVPRQRQYDDTLPTMSVFFRLMKKRWADVCVEVVDFCAKRLLPVGSNQFCRSLQLAEPVSSFASSRSSVFALRFSQFCSVFIDLSLFNWLPSTDISEFLSSIALDRTVLRSVQRFQDSSSVAPSVQLSLEQHQFSSSSSDSSSSLRFDQTDIDATASSRPTISPDLSAAFADFQAALSEQIFASQSDISSRMHKLEQSVCDSLRDQADIFRNLSQGARQEVRTLDDVHTIRFNEFRKNVLTQNATIFQGLADVRHEVEAVNAKVDIMASRLNAIQKDAEATKEALSHQLLEFQSSAQENHNVIHAQLTDSYSDLNQQLMLTSRCFAKIAKRRHLNKLTRHRFCERNQQMEKRICISAGEFFQAFFQSKFLTTTMDLPAGCDDISADVIIADSRSCASSQLLIMMTSSLLLIASSRIYADVITADSRFLFASIQQLISSTSEHCSLPPKIYSFQPLVCYGISFSFFCCKSS
ncbi:alpha-humulene/(-)-(E)-beta-caryophyllene synthase-like [Dorcoceras hygrometricum]|uniref:Alpha-humulene/(-)-(E)-beta-caryophyllene synthase-like n=1 Tax=Dorcoceras hygrometricum TaxID=472368 RepID=A0A2Z7BR31_9LAMI|nr:alpha-humulene/(-)-(E)-beta-caryophyllene synthase-like [Dorcoceras hygrometricum]